MEIYQRNIRIKIWLVRLVFVGLVLLCIYLFDKSLKDYAYVLIVFLCFGGIFPITSVSLYSNEIEIRRYFIYGLIPKKSTFFANKPILLDPFELEFNDAASWADMESFLNDQLLIHKFRIMQEQENGKVATTLIGLSVHEIKLIREHYLTRPVSPTA